MTKQNRLTTENLLHDLALLAAQGHEFVSSTQLVEVTRSSAPVVKRMLSKLVSEKRVETTGKARATRYRLLEAGAHPVVLA
jgi:hypothetical protein